MKKSEKQMVAWALAFEGCITLGRGNYKGNMNLQPQIAITNTDKELLQKFLDIVKSGKIYSRGIDKRWESHKPQFRWVIQNILGVRNFLKDILPHLPSKIKRGELLLEFCESRLKHMKTTYTERELEIFNKMKTQYR